LKDLDISIMNKLFTLDMEKWISF